MISAIRMFTSVSLSILLLIVNGVASAETLEEALLLAFAANPEIAAERAQLNATREGVAQARARGLPQITAGAGYEEVDNTQSISSEVESPRIASLG